jgi:hypothetical protein
MDRETFKTLSAGKFALSKLEDTIDKNQMLAFIEGAVFAWDYINKTKQKEIPKVAIDESRAETKPEHV